MIRKKKPKGINEAVKNTAKKIKKKDLPTPGNGRIRKLQEKNNVDLFKLSEREIKDLEIDSLPEEERDQIIRTHKSTYNRRRKEQKQGKIHGVRKKNLHTGVVKTQKKKNDTDRFIFRKKRKTKNDGAEKQLKTLLKKGGSLKDQKAKEIMNNLSPSRKYDRTYSDKIINLKNIQAEKGTGNIPSILDFGITYKEAIFITEYMRDYDEVRAARKAKITYKSMTAIESERAINELLNNPNVTSALQAAVQDQIHRTLVTSDRTISQIAKMAFADPMEIFKDDGSGTIRDIKDIPAYLRSCISEMSHKTLYHGRGDDRVVTGYMTKIKMHDSLKALQVLLKDIREKTGKTIGRNINFNQFNSFGPGNENMNERLADLSSEELDILLKLTNKGVEGGMKSINDQKQITDKQTDINTSSVEIIELQRAENLKNGTQLYSLDELKTIENDNLGE